MDIYADLQESKKAGKKKFVVLIDPDKVSIRKLEETLVNSIDADVDYFFIGGSLIVNDQLDGVLNSIKTKCAIPIILFPGNSFQLSYKADALLFLSLISGRNAELLIGKHVITAPFLKISPLEIISTGYMLIDGGVQTTVSYMSNTTPIPSNKKDIAMCTAMAGEMLGLKLMYLDAGSGATHHVPLDMVSAVHGAVNVPLIVGGGIRNPEQAQNIIQAGADIIVVGNAIEKNPELIKEISDAIHENQPNLL